MPADQIVQFLAFLSPVHQLVRWFLDLGEINVRFLGQSKVVAAVSEASSHQFTISSMGEQWIVAIVSSILGVVFGFGLTAAWDSYKNHQRFVALIRALILEIEANAKRASDVLAGLPEDIRQHFTAGTDVQLTDVQIQKISWGFPKPYGLDAWRTIVTAGFVPDIPPDLLEDLQKIYDHIQSINFLADLSLRTFAIMAVPNKLDSNTNQNFDRFCRIGTKSMEAVLVKIIADVPKRLAKLSGTK